MTKQSHLTRDEELFLINVLRSEKSASNHQWAMDKLVLSNVGLIHKIVHKFPIKNASCTYDDLFQAGIEGLIHGIHKFEPERGHRLTTYCYRWIQAYVSRYYQNHGKTIRVPVHLATAEMTINKRVEQLTRDLGRTPSDSEIESVCDNVEQVKLAKRQIVSLNQSANDDDEVMTLVGEDRTEEMDHKMEVDHIIDQLADDVSERDLNMFIHRYGLQGNKERTLNEIADYHKVTRARVHQVVRAVFNKAQAVVS